MTSEFYMRIVFLWSQIMGNIVLKIVTISWVNYSPLIFSVENQTKAFHRLHKFSSTGHVLKPSKDNFAVHLYIEMIFIH